MNRFLLNKRSSTTQVINQPKIEDTLLTQPKTEGVGKRPIFPITERYKLASGFIKVDQHEVFVVDGKLTQFDGVQINNENATFFVNAELSGPDNIVLVYDKGEINKDLFKNSQLFFSYVDLTKKKEEHDQPIDNTDNTTAENVGKQIIDKIQTQTTDVLSKPQTNLQNIIGEANPMTLLDKYGNFIILGLMGGLGYKIYQSSGNADVKLKKEKKILKLNNELEESRIKNMLKQAQLQNNIEEQQLKE